MENNEAAASYAAFLSDSYSQEVVDHVAAARACLARQIAAAPDADIAEFYRAALSYLPGEA
jgi:hypothetical protein